MESIKIKSKIINEIESRISFGKDKDTIKKEMLKVHEMISPELITKMVDDILENHGSYSLIQKIMRSKIVIDVTTDEIRIVDPVCKDYEVITQRVLNSLFDRKFNIDGRKFYCKHVYEPYSDNIIELSKNGVHKYNSYQPPTWYKSKFYSEGKKKVKYDEMPPIYEKFFKGFTDGDEKSYEYLLDWLANGVKSRNFCILTTISGQGSGKGVLGLIMRGVFGKHNYYSGSDRAFKGTFNSQLMNKRLVYIDEISIRKKEDEDRLKLVVNDFIEVERKGVDAVEHPNFANFYISSNNMDSLKLSGTDRRFSIINVSHTKLIEYMNDAEIKELLDSKNVNMLGAYLHYRVVDKEKMKHVFISKRSQQVRESALTEWNDWFLDEYCVENSGKTLTQAQVSDDLDDKFGSKFRPSRVALQKLLDLLTPDKRIFKVKKVTVDKKQVWSVVFK